MICSLNILFNHPVSEATPNSKITGAYCTPSSGKIFAYLPEDSASGKQCGGSGMLS